MQKPKFIEGQIYHIYNRGVEKRNIFLNDKDRFRFIHDLYEFNDNDAVLNVAYFFNPKSMEVEPQYIEPERKTRKILVEILVFVLMPNHFHLMLRQITPEGIVKFMQKLGTGYTMYFNKKYERVGPLFQGRFKAVYIQEHPHFLHLPFYIHANPLKLMSPYQGSTSIDAEKKIQFLTNYRWSSFPDYIGEHNFPSITSKEFLLEMFGGQKEYIKNFKVWIKEKNEDGELPKLIRLET